MPTFNTERLKELTSLAIKGAGFNKFLELSSLMGVRVKDGFLYLETTDGTNYLEVSDACVADDIDVTVNAELFSKLISKITSDDVDMYVSDNALVVEGNGKYTIALVPDETGNTLSFPNKFPEQTIEISRLEAADLLIISSTIKASLANIEGSVYSSYYFGDVVASTDKAMMSILNKNVFNEPMMLNKDFVDLMCMANTDATISSSGNMLVAEMNVTEKCTIKVCTPKTNNVGDFNIEGLNKFCALEINSFCRIRKAEILDLLDRLALFVTKFDDGAVQLEFTNTGVKVSSLASSGVEFIEYEECKNAENVLIKINIDRLRSQLKAYSSDMIDLYYGNDLCIKLVDGNTTQIIALIK